MGIKKIAIVFIGLCTIGKESLGKPYSERHVVTGSRIATTADEAPALVIKIPSDRLRAEGVARLGEFLANLPQTNFGSEVSDPDSNNPGFQGANLRGVGIDKTLVLLDGRRLPKSPGRNGVDLNTIPIAIIDRIEILLSSSSAVYGSDALAGVINIHSTKDFDHAEISSSLELTADGGGDRRQFDISYGFNSESFDAITSLSYLEQDALQQTERFWFDMFTASNGVPTSYQPENGVFVPFGGEEACPGSIVRRTQGVFCGFDLQPSLYYLAPEARLSLFQDIRYSLSSRSTFFGRFLVSRKDQDQEGLGSPLRGRTVGADRVNDLVEGGILPETVRDQNLAVQGRFADLPQRSETDIRDSALAVGHIWDWNATRWLETQISYGSYRQRNQRPKGYFLNDSMSDAIFTGSYDVFAVPGLRGDLSAETPIWSQERSSIWSLENTFHGRISNLLNSRAVSYVVGGSFQKESYSKDCEGRLADGLIFGLGCGVGSGERESSAVFTELEIPLSEVVVNLAARLDHHSDFGSAATPRLDTIWRPESGLFIRGGYSEGFKAPNLPELYDGSNSEQVGAIDYLRCREAQAASADADTLELLCEEPAQFSLNTSGNKDLREERSQSLHLGLGYLAAKWGLSVHGYYITIEDEIRFPDIEQVLLLESQGIAVDGVTVSRDADNASDPNALLSMSAGYLNISQTRTQGFDVSWYLEATESLGRLRWDSNLSYVLSYQSELLPGAGFQELVGQDQRPRWRAQQRVLTQWSGHSASFIINSLPAYKKADASAGSVDPFSTLDLVYQTTLPWDLSLELSAKNALRSTPPLDTTGGNDRGINGRLYDPRGTRYGLALRAKF
ncbi:TonB-dependent receptor plug domain-containing protein [Pseudobacteriovorax antillogorgiicola]|uniref:Outer membrane receptor proteins, mostly Fe transport n=1 Tax=Pseudobacteriovorax antillogorgiicola TaxID=1513793 RepID=A0A1Y6C609_9BACT|nr:TonB-dependent receptor [Pseudobacteriovorax antillogorgiicola]TCS49901.1 outer membrane receptor protein involved in Fe transport [Pseudobacteriovorax antillogorgiicola]SMF44792.1 Outer membrane receptor proteins, mostly Fe transport [Pseudobacteriovorax antillogorgiicola]